MSLSPAAPHHASHRGCHRGGNPDLGRDHGGVSWGTLGTVASIRQGSRGPGNARGAVTAEFAVALPAVLLLLALLLAGVAGGVTQLRLEEAARAGARALARGEAPAAVEGIVRTLAGTSATASVAADGEWLSVTVADRVGGPFGATVPWTLKAKATTRSETPAAEGVPQYMVPPQSAPVRTPAEPAA
jgi:Flp pilus assembly protein TadG